MPAAINEFIKEENYFKVREIQKQIIEYYFNEANRYANTSDKLKIRECLLSIPAYPYCESHICVIPLVNGSDSFNLISLSFETRV